MFLVCVLGFADHVELMRRCLGSIAASPVDPGLVAQIKIGLNAPTPRLSEYVLSVAKTLPVPVEVVTPSRGENVGKYPLMRRMIRTMPRSTPAHKLVMWFDDDSFLKAPYSPRWWSTVYERARMCHVLGGQYRINVAPQQRLAVEQQPWYAGERVRDQFLFITGGWWVANADFLRRWDYPFPSLHHRGGDVMLGELCRQQGARMIHFKDGVTVNADKNGKDSEGERRALSRTTQPVWQSYNPSKPDSLEHHRFDVRVLFSSDTSGLP